MTQEPAVLHAAATYAAAILTGYAVASTGLISDDGRKGIATLYAKLIFPTMVFRGVAAIQLATVDLSLVIVVLFAKLIVVLLCVVFCWRALSRKYAGNSLAHAAMLAMASSHSFDVTWGVPLSRALFPNDVPYIYLNQSVQLLVVNPLLLMVIELSAARGPGSTTLSNVLKNGLLKNPLVMMTLAGALAGQLFPTGIPPLLGIFTKHVADAGPFLGFLTLGFAVSALGTTGANELCICIVLAAFKMVLMPKLYLLLRGFVGCSVNISFLSFMGGLPASASVYSLSLVKGLSPEVIGPLVPLTMFLSFIFSLSSLYSSSNHKEGGQISANAIQLILGLVACACGLRVLLDSAGVGRSMAIRGLKVG